MNKHWNLRLIFAVVASTFGSAFQYGYHIGIINVLQRNLQKWLLDTEIDEIATKWKTLIWSTIVAAFSIGGIIGSLCTVMICDRLGRKESLLWNNVLVFIACLLLIFAKSAKSFGMFIVGRFVTGVNAGLNGTLVQIYLNEISPVALRGSVGSAYQLVITIGILTSQISGIIIEDEKFWPFLFIASMGPALFQLTTLPFCPETPKYLLITKGEETKAKKALHWLRLNSYDNKEWEDMKKEEGLIKILGPVNFKKICLRPPLQTPLINCLVIMLGQQLTGIQIVFYFSNQIFDEWNFGEKAADIWTAGFGTAAVCVTAASLCLSDLIGRRILLLTGFGTLAVVTFGSTIFLALASKFENQNIIKWLAITCFFLSVVMFAPGVGTIPWFITAEFFYHTARPLGVSLAVSVNWLAYFIVSEASLTLKAAIGYYLLMTFVIMDIYFLLYIYENVPETAHKSANEIIELYNEVPIIDFNISHNEE